MADPTSSYNEKNWDYWAWAIFLGNLLLLQKNENEGGNFHRTH